MVTVCKKDYMYRTEARPMFDHLFLDCRGMVTICMVTKVSRGMVIICMVTKVSMVTYF